MQKLPQDELKSSLSLVNKDDKIDLQSASRIKKKLAEEFREQLIIGSPNNEDEALLLLGLFLPFSFKRLLLK